MSQQRTLLLGSVFHTGHEGQVITPTNREHQFFTSNNRYPTSPPPPPCAVPTVTCSPAGRYDDIARNTRPQVTSSLILVVMGVFHSTPVLAATAFAIAASPPASAFVCGFVPSPFSSALTRSPRVRHRQDTSGDTGHAACLSWICFEGGLCLPTGGVAETSVSDAVATFRLPSVS